MSEVEKDIRRYIRDLKRGWICCYGVEPMTDRQRDSIAYDLTRIVDGDDGVA